MNTQLARMFDAHLHLQDPRLDGLRAAVLERARAKGVTAFCTCATSPADWDATAALEVPGGLELRRAFGVHPWYAGDLPGDWLGRLEALLRAHPDAPVGEVGLDGLRPLPGPASQRDVLVAQLELAARLGRPVVLHGARAWSALYDICRPCARRVPAFLVHAFSGSAEQLRDWLGIGAYVSVGGGACNPASKRIRAVAAAVPGERLVVETDSPDLLPPGGEPCVAGSRLNQPSNLVSVVTELAALRGMDADEVGRAAERAMRAFLGSAGCGRPWAGGSPQSSSAMVPW